VSLEDASTTVPMTAGGGGTFSFKVEVTSIGALSSMAKTPINHGSMAKTGTKLKRNETDVDLLNE
jgi:hypothetical protein